MTMKTYRTFGNHLDLSLPQVGACLLSSGLLHSP